MRRSPLAAAPIFSAWAPRAAWSACTVASPCLLQPLGTPPTEVDSKLSQITNLPAAHND
jgi:hypothetical protein